MQAYTVFTPQHRSWKCERCDGLCLHHRFRTMTQRENRSGLPQALEKNGGVCPLTLWWGFLKTCAPSLIIALYIESQTMTAIDHHAMICDSNWTNSTIATVMCVCCCCADCFCGGCFGRVADGIGVSNTSQFFHCLFQNHGVGCHFQHLQHQVHNVSVQEIMFSHCCYPVAVVQWIWWIFFSYLPRKIFIQSLFRHSRTVLIFCIVQGWYCSHSLDFEMILCFFVYTILVFKRKSLVDFKADVVQRPMFWMTFLMICFWASSLAPGRGRPRQP